MLKKIKPRRTSAESKSSQSKDNASKTKSTSTAIKRVPTKSFYMSTGTVLKLKLPEDMSTDKLPSPSELKANFAREGSKSSPELELPREYKIDDEPKATEGPKSDRSDNDEDKRRKRCDSLHGVRTSNAKFTPKSSPRERKVIHISGCQKATDTQFVISLIMKSIETGQNVVIDPESFSYNNLVHPGDEGRERIPPLNIYWAMDKEIVETIKSSVQSGIVPSVGNYSGEYVDWESAVDANHLHLYFNLRDVEARLLADGYGAFLACSDSANWLSILNVVKCGDDEKRRDGKEGKEKDKREDDRKFKKGFELLRLGKPKSVYSVNKKDRN